MTALNPRLQKIADLLAAGPRTVPELAAATGHDPDSETGRVYVRVMVRRIASHGYQVHNVRPPGSHRGAFYVLMARPPEPREHAACIGCGAGLRSGNDSGVCSACESRRRREAELPWPRLLPLFDARAVTAPCATVGA